ncbi:MAG: DUF4124 domain-containing protein [Ideonella sp.]|nr:DUF4124 domain-containing protein [Ideonella sp.]MBL0150356.1 DUF4124 domain-containing protein [Ideonella sp.]
MHAHHQKPITWILVVGFLLAETAYAQKLPLASRTVYKCVVNGKTMYSDEPCAGAERIVVEPTRGMNKSTGMELSGKDIQRERQTELIADAVKPITGMNPRQYDTARRRVYLPPEAKAECNRLDLQLPLLESKEQASTGEEKALAQSSLLALRKRQRVLGC